ncbi:MAG: O-antigen polymerase family protein, partial [Chloroflexi bacterium]|nr:O-antigen polymerase family protein [Chloroflexota bacterium]
MAVGGRGYDRSVSSSVVRLGEMGRTLRSSPAEPNFKNRPRDNRDNRDNLLEDERTRGAIAKGRARMSIVWRQPYDYALARAVAVALLAGAIIGGLALSTPPLTTLVVMLTVLGAVATLRNPYVGLVSFVMVAALLPFAVLPIRVVFSPTLVDLAVSLTLVGWLARAAYQHNAVRFGMAAALLTAFVVIALAAFTFGGSIAPVGAERARLFFKLLNSILLFITTVQVVRTQTQLRRLIQALLIGGTLAALAAIILHALPPSATLHALSQLGGIGYPTSEILRPIAGTETLRATGTSVDPNVLGGMLAVVAAIAIAQMLTPAPILTRRLLILAAVTCAGGLVLTYSRSALLGLLAATIFLASFQARTALTPLAAGVLALLLIPQGQLLMGRLISGFGAQDPAAAMRLGEYQNALSIIAQYPAIGIGFGESPRPD